MNKALVFKTYPDLLPAQQAAALLQKRGVAVEVRKEARSLDSIYVGQQFTDPYLLLLPGKDFERATIILDENIVINLDEVDPDYQLLSFSDEELIDVMRKKEEWGAYNYKLAAVLLSQRGVPIPEMDIVWSQAAELKRKQQPVSSGIILLLTGYASTLGGGVLGFMNGGHAAFTLLPGLLGLLIGWHLAYSKRTLPDGLEVAYFNEATRLHGVVMFWLSLCIALLKFTFVLILSLQES